jgi:propionyl-CoA carboxylase alpha chain
VESRIYAEDPYRSFLPSIGRLVRYQPPHEGHYEGYQVRNDAGVREGDEISMFYDPMIAKLCTHGPDRAHAVAGMERALDDFLLEGVGHNIPFLSAVMGQERFREGRLTTGYIQEEFPGGFVGLEPDAGQQDLMIAAAGYAQALQASRRLANGHKVREEWIVVTAGREQAVRLQQRGDGMDLHFAEGERILKLTEVRWRPGQPLFHGKLDGEPFALTLKPAAEGFDIRHRAASARVLVLSPRSAELHHKLPPKQPADTSRLIVSPMPGLVVSINVSLGQEVKSGEAVAIVEAMKMQNIIRAERDGVVKTIGAKAGDSVAADEVLVEFG